MIELSERALAIPIRSCDSVNSLWIVEYVYQTETCRRYTLDD